MWLSAHRFSANRVLGMQLTTKLMAKVGNIESGFSLAVTAANRTTIIPVRVRGTENYCAISRSWHFSLSVLMGDFHA